MPTTVENFPRPRRGRPPIYDWDACFDGQIHVFHQGTDFEVSPQSFRALVHRTAASRGQKAETQIKDTTVMFRFYEES